MRTDCEVRLSRSGMAWVAERGVTEEVVKSAAAEALSALVAPDDVDEENRDVMNLMFSVFEVDGEVWMMTPVDHEERTMIASPAVFREVSVDESDLAELLGEHPEAAGKRVMMPFPVEDDGVVN